MSPDEHEQHRSTKLLTRRALLRMSGAAAGSGVLAACAPGRSSTPSSPRVISPQPTPDRGATVLVRDVIDFTLRGPYRWNGGSVTMRLHAAYVRGQRAYFVRTDSSDLEFAKREGLVFVPLLAAALAAPERWLGELYLFDDRLEGQLPILSTVPGDADFTSLYRVHRVRSIAAPALLDSAQRLRAAAQEGRVRVEPTNVVVNYPVVKWPGGELPVDSLVERPLEGGPLLSPPDTERMVVTFKLHQCYPESRYVLTDTSAVPMAPMMNVVGSPRTEGLAEAGATDTITVFANGIPGPGAMGFQPGIFGRKAGDLAWSPMWDHWTAVWKNPRAAVLLKSQAELEARVRAGEIELHRGTPDTKGKGFVVNCPSPIVAPNDFAVSG